MLRVFEAFSGVGSQHMALRNINAHYKIVATSEIDENAIISYYFVHKNDNIMISKVGISEMISYLVDKGIGDKNKFAKMSIEKIEKLYIASIYTKNLGNISKLNPNNIPNHDIFTYSFPCQDISSIGTRKGFDKDSGTRLRDRKSVV